MAVDPADPLDPGASARELLASLRRRGVLLWSLGDQLHYKAPKGTLTPSDFSEIHTLKNDLIWLLAATVSDSHTERLCPRQPAERVPLTYTQQVGWRLLNLDGARSARQVASAVRVTGRLQIEELQSSITEIVRRHEALRTRLVICEGTRYQHIDEPRFADTRVLDLTRMPENVREVEARRLIEDWVATPINVSRDSLFAALLLRLSETDHIVMFAVDHLVSDAASLDILTREVWVAYDQLTTGVPIRLPAVIIQFPDYAVWQSKNAHSWREKHGAYWEQFCAGQDPARFPVDAPRFTAAASGWGAIPFRIDSELKAAVEAFSRAHRTTLPMSCFAVYAAWVARWCESPTVFVRYQANGRTTPEVENTIGYFACPIYIRMVSRPDDCLVDLVKRASEEYCEASGHADFCFLETQDERQGLTRTTTFNWVSRPSEDESFVQARERVIRSSPFTFHNPPLNICDWDMDPTLVLVDHEESVDANLFFPADRFSSSSMARFADGFVNHIRELMDGVAPTG